MDTVTLKSKYGPTQFRRLTHVPHPNGMITTEMRDYVFSLENDCRAAVPVEVWKDLEDEWFDRKFGLKYREAFKIL